MTNFGAKPARTIDYRYRFVLDGGVEKAIHIRLDSRTMNIVETKRESCPPWTELGFYRCTHCRLDEERHTYCPIAVNVHDVIEAFKGCVSFQEADLFIDAESRQYRSHTTLQKGLGALLGIYMVTSGCPIMEKLKPMVRYHLPFATEEETVYRVISMYLFAQYFVSRRGGKPDWALEKLVDLYRDVGVLNRCFCSRLKNMSPEDGCVNAVIILDCFAKSVILSVNREMIREIETSFSAYFEGES
jgi:hypothetical protein